MVLAKIILFLVVLLIGKKVGDKSTDVLENADWLRFIFFRSLLFLQLLQ